MSSNWDLYESRMAVRGFSRREEQLKREKRYLEDKVKATLSYHAGTLIDGVERNVAIINSDNLNIKTIISMPGETLKCGALVYWMNQYWLIEEKDFNTEVYTKASMIQCNYLLHWVDRTGKLHEQWCYIEDGTKYLTGEYEDRYFITARGDSRIAMTIARNEDTVLFDRQCRFIIDDPESETRLAYTLSKPLKTGHVFGAGDDAEGVYKFVLQEVNSTDDDNIELGVADYYKYFPRVDGDDSTITPPLVIDPDNKMTEDGREMWL